MKDVKLKNTHKLVRAVFANDLTIIKEIIESGDFYKRVLNDVLGGLKLREIDVYPDYGYNMEQDEPVFPIYYITLCNSIYLDGWGTGNHVVDNITANHKISSEILEYWRDLGFQVDEPIDFSKYRSLIAPGYPDDFHSTMDGNMTDLLLLGYDYDEIRLCYAIKQYYQKEIFELLEKGVNPDVFISGEYLANGCLYPEDEGSTGFEHIWESIDDPICPGDYYNYLGPVRNYDDQPLLRLSPFYDLFAGAAYTIIANKITDLRDKGVLKFKTKNDKWELENKIKGCLMGLGIANSLGRITNLMIKNEVLKKYPEGVNKLQKNEGIWEDDNTKPFLSIIDKIIDHKGIDAEGVAKLIIGNFTPIKLTSKEPGYNLRCGLLIISIIGIWKEGWLEAAESVAKNLSSDLCFIGSSVILATLIHNLIWEEERLSLLDIKEIGDRFDKRISGWIDRGYNGRLTDLNLVNYSQDYILKGLGVAIRSYFQESDFMIAVKEIVNEGGYAIFNASVEAFVLGAKSGGKKVYYSGLYRGIKNVSKFEKKIMDFLSIQDI